MRSINGYPTQSAHEHEGQGKGSGVAGRFTLMILSVGGETMKRLLRGIAALLLVAVAYLTLWPVPIDPVAWNPPVNEGYVGAFASNEYLEAIERVPLVENSGPEDVAIGPDGKVYVSTHEGTILKLDPQTNTFISFADTQGRPLGIEFGPRGVLYVADAYRGLLAIDQAGTVSLLTDTTSDGSPILYADDLDITRDGVVYFSDASTKFGAKEFGGTLPASLLDIFEHGPNGRILKYDPASGETTTIHEGMSFANGVALTKDERFLLVAETGSYAIHRIDLAAPENVETLLSNLPGFPDNINGNPDGTFWFGLVSPRSQPADDLAGSPFLRKLVQRLPAFVRPKPLRYGFIARMDENGNIIETLQGPSGDFALTTGAIDGPGGPGGKIYVSSLTEPDLGIINRSD